jgi:hypothetical protein
MGHSERYRKLAKLVETIEDAGFEVEEADVQEKTLQSDNPFEFALPTGGEEVEVFLISATEADSDEKENEDGPDFDDKEGVEIDLDEKETTQQ